MTFSKNKVFHDGNGVTTIFIKNRNHGNFECLVDTDLWHSLGLGEVKWNAIVKTSRKKRQIHVSTNRKVDGQTGTYKCPKSGELRARTKWTTLSLHRLLMGQPPANNMMVDHINRNTLDNRRENLRWATAVENARNRSHSSNSTPYSGVDKRNNTHTTTYRAQVKLATGKQVSLGHFPSAEEAALVRDEWTKENFGEFANLNFPDGPSPEILKKIDEARSLHQERKEEVKIKESLRMQEFNRKRKKTSQYYGVTKGKSGKFYVNIFKDRERLVPQGAFDSEIEAAKFYDKMVVEHGLTLTHLTNFLENN